MRTTVQKDLQWLKSKDAIKALKVTSCDLMHLRIAGKIEYKKSGNSFLYSLKDITKLTR